MPERIVRAKVPAEGSPEVIWAADRAVSLGLIDPAVQEGLGRGAVISQPIGPEAVREPTSPAAGIWPRTGLPSRWRSHPTIPCVAMGMVAVQDALTRGANAARSAAISPVVSRRQQVIAGGTASAAVVEEDLVAVVGADLVAAAEAAVADEAVAAVVGGGDDVLR